MKKQQFPQIEDAWEQLFNTMIPKYVKQNGPLSRIIPSIPLYEGGTFGSKTKDSESLDSLQSVSATLLLHNNVLRETDLVEFRRSLVEWANEMTGNIERGAILSIGEQISQNDNTVNLSTEPLTWEVFISVLEKMDWSFDVQGEWVAPTIVLSPELIPQITKLFAEAESDPEKLSQFEELKLRKKAEFDDREANRKLVK